MSRLGVLAASTLAALATSGAAAAFTPQPPWLALKTLKLTPIQLPQTDKALATCRSHPRKLRGNAERLNRKVQPVACEQPPRSKVQDAGFVVVFAP
jgi:hypothetical protein